MSGASELRILKDVPYVENGTERQRCEIYFGASKKILSDNSAVILYFHGGGWIRGDRSLAEVPCRALATRGITALSCGYTLVDPDTDSDVTVCLRDVAAVISWIRSTDAASKLGVSPKNIFLVGHSAGAHLIMMICLQPKFFEDFDNKFGYSMPTSSFIRGAIGLGGVYDLDLVLKANSDFSKILYPTFGKRTQKWASLSPSTCDAHGVCFKTKHLKNENEIKNIMPRVLLVHSHEDDIVDGDQADTFVSRFEPDGDDSDDDECIAELVKGHFGTHHEMYKKKDVHDLIANFVDSVLNG